MDTQSLNGNRWSENVIIADADYTDSVAFNLIVNFERMLERRIPQADFAHWVDCVALDGGVKEGENQTQVVLIHDKTRGELTHFRPSDYEKELNGKAFKDNLGEFAIASFAVEDLVSRETFFADIVSTVCRQEAVRRVMIIPNAENAELWDMLRRTLHTVNDEKRITLFAMQPMPGGNFRQEILGYSLMSALGIQGSEINKD